MNEIVLKENVVENLIYEIRGVQVMLASDVAKLYNSEVRIINQVVKRNINRFPSNFCFQLTASEYEFLKSQIVISKEENSIGRGGNRHLPYVFTEHGIMMLSGLLKSDIAANVNVIIIKAFVTMRHYISNNLIEQKYINNMVIKHDNDIKLLQESFKKFDEKKITNEIYFNGQIYDAYSIIIDILRAAKEQIIIIDGYTDKSTLDIIRNTNVKTIIITKRKSNLNATDINKYNKQYHNLKIIYNETFHDRYIIIDNNIVYHCGASINHAGSRTFSINILEDDIVKQSLITNINNEINRR